MIPLTKTTSITCQICGKKGHSTLNCWHRMNIQYFWPPQKTLFIAANQDTTEWFIDISASSHISIDIEDLSNSLSYQGQYQITIGDGNNINIANCGKGLLSTPNCKLYLNNFIHVPKISHNFLSISNLIVDNTATIIFDIHG